MRVGLQYFCLICLEFVMSGVTSSPEICTYIHRFAADQCMWWINVHGGSMYVAVARDSASHSNDVWVNTGAVAGGGGH